jgi:hypothetical protein
MGTRRVRLTIVAWLCGLVWVLGVYVTPGVAGATELGATHFGEKGSGAGQLLGPSGVAVNNDSSSLFYGDVYVVERYNNRVSRFGGSGAFQLAWGWGVANGANELQTCMASCHAGPPEGAAADTGAIDYASAVAVDSDPLSSSSGDVYVGQYAGNERVEKFGPSGEFLLMFGGEVNEGKDKTPGATEAEKDVCVAGETCQRGTRGSADGQLELGEDTAIAVGPDGMVYVGGGAHVAVFEPSGAWKQSISLAGLPSSGEVTALAVNSVGNLFVSDSEVAGVREFEPDGVEEATQFDAASTSIASIALGGSGEVFVGDSDGSYNGFHVLKYTPSGNAVGNFGSNTVRGGIQNGGFGAYNGMAFSEASGDLYISERYEEQGEVAYDSVWTVPVPPPGPVIESLLAKPGPRASLTLEATINPEGGETTYHFEYVSDADYEASGYTDASSTPVGSLAPGLENESVSAQITGLPPSTGYHYRVVAASAEGTSTSSDQTVETLPSAIIDAEYATNVASTSVTLDADINPLGSRTEYRLEYGTSTSYGHTLTGNVGEGATGLVVGFHLQELVSGTTYHYRFVANNDLGIVVGIDHEFTMQSAGGELTLLDGRAWELVSPPDKNGILIEPSEQGETMMQAAEGGGSITYLALGPLGSGIASNSTFAQILSTRGSGGWSSEDIESPHEKPTEIASADREGTLEEDRFFSADLSLAAVEPVEAEGEKPLSTEATEPTVYVRDNATGAYRALVTTSNVPVGTKFGSRQRRVEFVDATPDMSHVILRSPEVLTENAKQAEEEDLTTENDSNLYEWANGRLQLVNILPNGESTYGKTELGRGSRTLGHAVSDDGRRIVWETEESTEPHHKLLYMRDMVDGVTVQLGGPDALFQTASTDGSKIFFNFKGDLMVYDANTGSTTNLSVPLNTGEGAGVASGLMGTSEDGSHVYFVASGVLAGGATSGEDNLYLSRDTSEGWQTTFIATLSKEDETSWVSTSFLSPGEDNLSGVSSRVSPDGEYVAFMSERSLTGYDNLDAVSGQPDEEVYVYSAAAGRLVCASCDPTGARPVGVLDKGKEALQTLLVDRHGSWNERQGTGPHWLAGSIPGWAPGQGESGFYQPRYLSNSGRLFFNSPVGLVPQATDGLENVYEYEPADVGSCTSEGTTFVKSEGGCVDLVTSGTSAEESVFYDASASGDDVFFLTTSRLTAADYDNSYDVYDAHVCSASSPCISEPVSPPPCTTADSCKPAPSPQPTSFGAPASATFTGQGNIAPTTSKPMVKSAKPKHKKKAVKRRKRHRVGAKKGKAKKSSARGHSSVRTQRNGGAKRS